MKDSKAKYEARCTNMATKDKMQTTAGSWALLGSIVPRDAHVVSKLREAGTVILGHANMSEWASVRSKAYSTGYSPRRGQVRNPYDLSSSPFGSSGGSAVSVSANIVPLSFGTETDTSIIGPSLINGVVGIKPTVGLTSRNGVIPITESMDTVGSMGRTVYDAVLGLDAIVGPDKRDQSTLNPSRHQEDDYNAFMSDRHALQGAKFGMPMKRCWDFVPEDQREVANKILDAITAAGGELIETDFPCTTERIPETGTWDWLVHPFGEPSKSEFTVVKVEAYNTINAYLSELSNTSIKNLEDVIAFNEENAGTEGASPGDHPAFPNGQDNFHEIIKQCGVRDDTYRSALAYIQEESRRFGIDGALKHVRKNGESVELDALILCDRKGIGQQMAAQAGYPIICVPIGLDAAGFPVGLTLHQTAWKEGALIRWASAIEDLRNHVFGPRPTPTYREYLSKNIPIARKYTT
ncbi:hypothetical protein W97_06381 [Coniosporium apollinis CBS 100218]|uniref:Amidase domain-containing protein n=1 Tax=Coniosporium apollinis (strain CBS 100218) TaxID=1168221 RepID=R7YZ74_CONA1|nr:uncharacterized protein W97_06381 [Coniosporium apollinis CBS 100218]EON67128.1 hypothetical protein W97_06381 [Coniosporium apollinis CBS 100218]